MNARGVGDVEIAPGRSGQFDIVVDGRLAFSRHDTGRFPTDEEIDATVGL
ncbi:MAG: Rdx family protein [Rhodospirillales bacterium]|nr:Rdx family protein [Rhodospirillales bacterium]QQS15158.1 MAG: Rdx family protein [Rhodospirillales bacterium]